MSSSYDAGYWADKASEDRKTECEKSSDGEHEFERHGSWPSHWDECKNCGLHLYYK